MTEDQAKATLCCGPPAVAAAAYYRAGVACDAPMHCIGSACMAWRSTRMAFKDNSTGKLTDRDLTGHGSWVSTDGFCGLAGPVQ